MKHFDITQKPSLIQNPQKGNYLDLNPFFYYLNVLQSGDLASVSHIIDEAIQFMVSTVTDKMEASDIMEFQNATYNLYLIRDMFRLMENFKK